MTTVNITLSTSPLTPVGAVRVTLFLDVGNANVNPVPDSSGTSSVPAGYTA